MKFPLQPLSVTGGSRLRGSEWFLRAQACIFLKAPDVHGGCTLWCRFWLRQQDTFFKAVWKLDRLADVEWAMLVEWSLDRAWINPDKPVREKFDYLRGLAQILNFLCSEMSGSVKYESFSFPTSGSQFFTSEKCWRLYVTSSLAPRMCPVRKEPWLAHQSRPESKLLERHWEFTWPNWRTGM
jgi:hypothetical protein